MNDFYLAFQGTDGRVLKGPFAAGRIPNYGERVEIGGKAYLVADFALVNRDLPLQPLNHEVFTTIVTVMEVTEERPRKHERRPVKG